MKDKKLNYYQLENHAIECQLEADEMAIKLINQSQLFSDISILQGICDFNLYFAYQISPVLIHNNTINVLSGMAGKFTRKLTLNEFFKLDTIIHHLGLTNFRDIKQKFIT